MKRVLVFSLTYFPRPIGGAEIAIHEITKRIDPTHISFHLIALRFDSSVPAREQIGNVTIHRIGFTKTTPSPTDLVSFPLALNKFLFPFLSWLKATQLHREHRFQAAWGVMAAYAGLGALLFKLTHPSVPYLLTLQEGDPIEYILRKVRFFHPLFQKIFTSADVIQTISSYLGHWGRNMGFTGPLEVVPNAVDVRHFSTRTSVRELAALRRKLGIQSSDVLLITTSRLVPKNGILDVIKALPALPAYVKFLILGEGPLEEHLQKEVEALGLRGRVMFGGHVSHKELPRYLHISHIFIRPSLSEGMGNSFVEAMAAKVPVIATQEGGLADFLFDPDKNPGKLPTGLAVSPHDPVGIARQVKRYLEDLELTKKIVDNAYALVVRKYDWDLIAQDMRKRVFEKLFASRKKKTHILIAAGLFPPDVGGAATHAQTLARALPSHGFAVTVVSFGLVRRWPKIVRHLLYTLRLIGAGRAADVIYALDPVSVGLPAVIVAKLFRKRFVLRITGDYAWEQATNQLPITTPPHQFSTTLRELSLLIRFLNVLQRFVAREAHAIITPSRYLASCLNGWGINQQKIHVVYNGVTPPAFSANRKTLRGLLSFDGLLIVSAGRLIPLKRFDDLISVMPQLLKKFPSAKLMIIGDGPERTNLEKRVQKLSLRDRVVIAPALPQDVLFRYIAAADVFVLNSVHETFSHLLLEVSGIGTPIVATRVGGTPEIIEHEGSGILVPPRNRPALARAIERVLSDPALRQKVTTHARASLSRFSEQAMVEAIESILSFDEHLASGLAR